MATDGDSRAMSSMKYNLKCLTKNSESILDNLKSEQFLSFVQDSIHIGTKCRNRSLKASIVLPMGPKQVSVSHLKILISTFPKDTHGLVLSDICPDDRQNFRSFEKVSDPHVIDCLRKHVIDSEATAKYFEQCRAVTSSYTVMNMAPLDRVYSIWRAVFFFRAWRKWIQLSDCYTVKENFLTSNAHSSIEINAYGLLHLITKFRDSGSPELFQPALFNSQTCEHTFRQMRSMTTIYWTRINFSLLELLHIVGRIELVNDIIHDKLKQHDVKFPRLERQSNQCPEYDLPTNEEIREILQKAQQTALNDAAEFGMTCTLSDLNKCPITNVSDKVMKRNKCSQIDECSDDDDDDDSDENMFDEPLFVCNSLRDYSSEDKQCEEDSRFVQVSDDNGSMKTVRKSSLLWLLTDSPGKLSNSRLSRVQGSTTPNSRKRKQSSHFSTDANKRQCRSVLFVSEELKIGDICFFSNKKFTTDCFGPSLENVFVGVVLGFKYINGKNEKDKQYGLNFAPVKPPEDLKNKKPARGLETLATWYRCDNELKLHPVKTSHFFINIEEYIATTSLTLQMCGSKPIFEGNTDELKNCILELIV